MERNSKRNSLVSIVCSMHVSSQSKHYSSYFSSDTCSDVHNFMFQEVKILPSLIVER